MIFEYLLFNEHKNCCWNKNIKKYYIYISFKNSSSVYAIRVFLVDNHNKTIRSRWHCNKKRMCTNSISIIESHSILSFSYLSSWNRPQESVHITNSKKKIWVFIINTSFIALVFFITNRFEDSRLRATNTTSYLMPRFVVKRIRIIYFSMLT